MLRLTATLIASIYVALSIWGLPPGEDFTVTRMAPLDGPLLGAGAAEAAPAPAPSSATDATATTKARDELRNVSAEEAVKMALAAGNAPAASQDPQSAGAAADRPGVARRRRDHDP